MSTLRNAYSAKKTRHNEIISEAALNWLKDNVILINEKIDRKTVSRLIDSIKKFEDTFGPFKTKLPTLARHLDMAEASLNMVITGRVSDKKTSQLLEQLTYLYSAFSDFFTRDLPVLMKTKLFDTAKQNPTVPLNRLHVQVGNFNQYLVREALQNALRPDAEEKRLLRKIYRGTALPKINVAEITEQLLSLTYTDLEELTKIGRVPMVVADEGGTDLGAELGSELPEAVVKSNGEKFLSEDAAEEMIREAAISMKEMEMLTEHLLKEVNVSEIQPSINALKKIVNSVEILRPLSGPINDLQSKVLTALADGDVKTYLSQATSSKNPISILKNLFSTPQGTVISQANMAVETLKNVSTAWDQIKPITDKDDVTAADVNNIKKILTKNVKGGIITKLSSMFKTQPFPGLSPDEVLNALFKPLDDFLSTNESVNQKKTVLEQSEASGTSALDTFKTAMTQLKSALSGKGTSGGTSPTATTTGTASTTSSASTTQTKQTSGTEPTGKGTGAGAPGAPVADSGDETKKNIETAFKNKLKPEQVNQLTSILVQQGYSVVKK